MALPNVLEIPVATREAIVRSSERSTPLISPPFLPGGYPGFPTTGFSLPTRESVLAQINSQAQGQRDGYCPCPPSGQRPLLGQPDRPQKPFQQPPQNQVDLCDELLGKVGLSLQMLCDCLAACGGGGKAKGQAVASRSRRPQIMGPFLEQLPGGFQPVPGGSLLSIPGFGAPAKKKKKKKSIFMGAARAEAVAMPGSLLGGPDYTTNSAEMERARRQAAGLMDFADFLRGVRRENQAMVVEAAANEILSYGAPVQIKRLIAALKSRGVEVNLARAGNFQTRARKQTKRERAGLGPAPARRALPAPSNRGPAGSQGYRVLANGACFDVATRKFAKKVNCVRR
jgi:hypothetical protein